MPCEITFETASLNDAIQKCARVAPTKGPAFDKAAGILCEVDIESGCMILRVTDTEIFYTQTVKATDAKGSSVRWRLPSGLMADIVKSLPMTQDSLTTLIDRGIDGEIRLKCGRTVGKFTQIKDIDGFPRMPEVDVESLKPAVDLANKIEQVSWATDNGTGPLSGVYIDGQRIVATNRYCMAVVPCSVPVEEPVIAPLDTIDALIKAASDLKLRAEEKRLLFSLDPESRATMSLIEGRFPNVDMVARDNFTGSIDISKSSLNTIIERVNGLVKADRQPKLAMHVQVEGGLLKELILDMEVPGVGRLQDGVQIETAYPGPDFQIKVQPDQLVKAIQHTQTDGITISFGHPDPKLSNRSSVRITDQQGYACWMAPVMESGNK